MSDKFVKLSAIERMAKPMASFHGGGKPEMEEESDDMCVCPKCGHEYEHGSEEEYEEEDED
jgi:hypothetical protein